MPTCQYTLTIPQQQRRESIELIVTSSSRIGTSNSVSLHKTQLPNHTSRFCTKFLQPIARLDASFVIWRQGTLTFFTGATARCSHTHAVFFSPIHSPFFGSRDRYILHTYCFSLLVGGEFWYYWSCSFQRSKGKRQFVSLLFA